MMVYCFNKYSITNVDGAFRHGAPCGISTVRCLATGRVACCPGGSSASVLYPFPVGAYELFGLDSTQPKRLIELLS